MDDQQEALMETRSPVKAISWQAEHCRRADAPITARLIQAMLPLLDGRTACGRRMRDWPGLTAEDAMPLRLCGGYHHLHLTGEEPRLAAIYSGLATEQDEIDDIVLAVTRNHDERLLRWFDSPPQTNEAGRSASLMAGLLWLSIKLRAHFEVNEIGASAGINTMMDRYAYNLGGVAMGPADSPMRIEPEWRGHLPPAGPVQVVSIQGCDVNPIDLTDNEAALRLKSYVWPENIHRMERIETAIALASQRPPSLERADAGDWLERRLSSPQAAGVTRVLVHSIVWQYLPISTRKGIEACMARAGLAATRDCPLAWVQLETNRRTFRHELRARYWPGGEDWSLLGQAHAHGAWVEWFGV